MPKVSNKKGIRSERNKLVLLLIFIAVFGVFSVTSRQVGKTRVRIGDKTIIAEVADSPKEQEKGLGGRDSLTANAGMLFVFNKSQVLCFWMKDMRFNIDIIWLDQAKKIVHIEPNVTPATYPHNFCPLTPAQYGLEVNAGVSKTLGLTIGDSISF